jgi:hypothetical protein
VAGTLPRDASNRLELHVSVEKAGVTTLMFKVPPEKLHSSDAREFDTGVWQNLWCPRLAEGRNAVTDNFTGATGTTAWPRLDEHFGGTPSGERDRLGRIQIYISVCVAQICNLPYQLPQDIKTSPSFLLS